MTAEPTYLDKAKAAIDAARDHNAEDNQVLYAKALDQASVLAAAAQAEALTRIADVLEDECKIGGALHALTQIAQHIANGLTVDIAER
jgi:hypothetical protein